MEDTLAVKYYELRNNDKPHCWTCGKIYPKNSAIETCTEYQGRGKKRRMCNGQVVHRTYLDWSINSLNDYSIMKHGDLRVYNEAFVGINQKLDAAKIGQDRETGTAKVNVSNEIEQFMRKQGVDVISWEVSRKRSDGRTETALVTKSFYTVPFGVSKVSQFAYDDLFERFGARARTDKGDTEGFMIFRELKPGEKVAVEKPKVENLLECVCGFKAKSEFGLRAHQRACPAIKQIKEKEEKEKAVKKAEKK